MWQLWKSDPPSPPQYFLFLCLLLLVIYVMNLLNSVYLYSFSCVATEVSAQLINGQLIIEQKKI